MHIVYFITAHGYGHGVRSCAIANALDKDIRLTFRCDLPPEFLRAELRREFSHVPGVFDCGCVQRDSVSVDIDATLRTYMETAERNRAVLRDEISWCKDIGADAIISDITPFAFDVAREAGIPSVAATNFTWYDIYGEYVAKYQAFRPYLDEIRRQYASADLLLALEPPNPMDYFPHRKDTPVVGRLGRNIRGRLQNHFGIDPSRKIGLIYAGSFGMDAVAWERLALFSDWDFLGVYELPGSPQNYHVVSKADFPYQDLTASVDIMITKIGYGAVSECFLHGTPLLYLPRYDFAEYPVLEAAVRRWGGGYCISQQEFFSLEWKPVLDLIGKQARPAAIASGGAEFCAREIERICRWKR